MFFDTRRISIRDSVDLLVVSHNFFDFTCNSCNAQDKNTFIQNCLAPMINATSLPKIPLVMGFDLHNGITHPYNGTNGIVVYFDTAESLYRHNTSIWESWTNVGKCDRAGFVAQNKHRTFNLHNKVFGLLSCGDTVKSCYGAFSSCNLPTVDIYLNPSHIPVKGHASQHKNPPKFIINNTCQYCLGTRQLNTTPRQQSLIHGNPTILQQGWTQIGQQKSYLVDIQV